MSLDTYDVPKSGRITRDIKLHNVMAVLPGKSARRIYVSGHYDSFAACGRRAAAAGAAHRAAPQRGRPRARCRQAALGAEPRGRRRLACRSGQAAADAPPVDNPAPGVNDDGSGTAMVMELARVFGESGIEFDATLVFIALAGEEQGLIGATMHAEKAAAEKVVIDAVLNNDMIGNVAGAERHRGLDARARVLRGPRGLAVAPARALPGASRPRATSRRSR